MKSPEEVKRKLQQELLSNTLTEEEMELIERKLRTLKGLSR